MSIPKKSNHFTCWHCGKHYIGNVEENALTATDLRCEECKSKDVNKLDEFKLKEKEIPKKASKGIKIGSEVGKIQKRLGATGISISNGKLKYNIPKHIQDQRNKDFDKKKKAKKLAKKNKKKNRR